MVSITGNVSLNISDSIERQVIVADVHCVPAAETAGYAFFHRCFKHSPWFQPRETEGGKKKNSKSQLIKLEFGI